MTSPIDSSQPTAVPPLWRWGDRLEALESCWKEGGIVAIPTESTYGLAVDPDNAEAVESVVRCKGRSAQLPLPVLAASAEDLLRLGVRLDLPVLEPAIAAWPAALTVVAPLERPVAAALGMPTLAVRVPDHEPLRRLLAATRRTVTGTSANRSGEKPAVRPGQVKSLLTGVRAVIIDGEDLPGGEPSTIVGIDNGQLIVLRQGRYDVAGLFGT